MDDPKFPWKRFWCPREGIINLADGGYLYIPDTFINLRGELDPVPIENLENTPCLILLGEPGIGKSTEIAKYEAVVKERIQEIGDSFLSFDLRDYQSDQRLFQSLFGNLVFEQWIEGIHQLYFFLDSLDEALININTLATSLIRELSQYPTERMRFRIACRTADWPLILENGLTDLWGKEHVGVYELTPLRRVDVIEASVSSGVDSVQFIDEVAQKEAQPFAIKPVTLNFLLNIYRKEGHFPKSKTALYFEGCQLLCSEANLSRIASKRIGYLSPMQRMIIAARIAAVTVFSNRAAIWTDLNLGEVPETDVKKDELIWGTEWVDDQEFQLSIPDIEETLDTGLFSARGQRRMGWAHQTYAEFLAAWYLVHHNVSLSQMISLVEHPEDRKGRLIPQLHETAAWLSSLESQVFKEITNRDPKVLLYSDIATADVNDRADLVDRLLRMYDKGELLERDWGDYHRYNKLNHPELAEQLRPYVQDISKNELVRRVAVEIARACNVQGLQQDLVNIAMDEAKSIHLRASAAFTVSEIGDGNAKIQLKPLALGQAGEDPEDELKGCGLRALWPEHITAGELFSIISFPKKDNIIGVYDLFLNDDLVKHLQVADIPVALEWVKTIAAQYAIPSRFDRLIDSILWLGWQNLDEPLILPPFAGALLSLLDRHHRIIRDRIRFGSDSPNNFRKVLQDSEQKRRSLIQAMLPLIKKSEFNPLDLIFTNTPIVFPEDVLWLIAALKSTDDLACKRILAKLIFQVFNQEDQEQVDATFYASEDDQILGEFFRNFFQPIPLDSEQAADLREMHQRRRSWAAREQDEKEEPQSPTALIATRSDQFEAGDFDAWWHLNVDLIRWSRSNEFETDLTVLSVWMLIDDSTKSRLIRTARKYVEGRNSEPEKWIGENKEYRPAHAGYRAIKLLLSETPDIVYAFQREVWKQWAPAVLYYSQYLTDSNEDQDRLMLKLAYQNAPDEIIKTLMALIDKENGESGQAFIVRRMEFILDSRLEKNLLEKLSDDLLKEGALGDILGMLLSHRVADAVKSARELAAPHQMNKGVDRSRALVAMRLLFIFAANQGWDVIWPTVNKDPEFADELFRAIAFQFDRYQEMRSKSLSADQLADLFILLSKRYPHREDPHPDGFHEVASRERLGQWRDSILMYLKGLGTPESCTAIWRISQRLPHLQWLKRVLSEAESITLRRTWNPPEPRHILRLVREPRLRLVESGNQLLDILIESLERLQAKLHGETYAVQFLWNKVGKDKYTPKDENSLSDFVKLHLIDELRERGIIINREVKIQRGQKTDIHVNAIKKSKFQSEHDVITAIIETKGCWHPELERAMQTQLMDRYLIDNQSEHGLYLVGWFNSDRWDDEDYKKQQAPKYSLVEAQQRFANQAEELSESGLKIKSFVIDAGL
jgi:predicted NACHT family NTPase